MEARTNNENNRDKTQKEGKNFKKMLLLGSLLKKTTTTE